MFLHEADTQSTRFESEVQIDQQSTAVVRKFCIIMLSMLIGGSRCDGPVQRRVSTVGSAEDNGGDSTLISSIAGRPPADSGSVDGSSVGTASSLDSVSTNEDAAFRAGLARLDANIARVQRRLQQQQQGRAGRISVDQCQSRHQHDLNGTA